MSHDNTQDSESHHDGMNDASDDAEGCGTVDCCCLGSLTLVWLAECDGFNSALPSTPILFQSPRIRDAYLGTLLRPPIRNLV